MGVCESAVNGERDGAPDGTPVGSSVMRGCGVDVSNGDWPVGTAVGGLLGMIERFMLGTADGITVG